MINLINTLDTCNFGSISVEIPPGIFNVVSLIIKLIQVAVPVMLIIWGMIDFAKAVVGGDEDKIKAGQKLFLKRLIAAVIVFLVVTIVTLLLNLVGQVVEGGTADVDSCFKLFINGANSAK